MSKFDVEIGLPVVDETQIQPVTLFPGHPQPFDWTAAKNATERNSK